jgi:L-fuconolactonase
VENSPDDWHKLTGETAIKPEIQICDSHHHLWYPAAGGYTLEDFRRDISGGHNIVQTVFIESHKMLRTKGPMEMRPVGETEFVSELVTSSPKKQSGDSGIAAGIVGFVDLTLGKAVIPVLEAHIAAGRDRFKGVRFTTTWDASPDIKSSSQRGIMASPQFRNGFATLSKYNLSFDAWLYYHQLSEMAQLAHAFPDIPVVIDHAGGPLGIGPYAVQHKVVFQVWKKNIAALAEYDNVYIKLGGLGMDICGFGLSQRRQPPTSTELAKQFAPYFLWCIERFGVNRCMFESNFPVDKKAYPYTVLWNAFKRIVADFSKSENQALFHNTAAKFYHLPRAMH